MQDNVKANPKKTDKRIKQRKLETMVTMVYKQDVRKNVERIFNVGGIKAS